MIHVLTLNEEVIQVFGFLKNRVQALAFDDKIPETFLFYDCDDWEDFQCDVGWKKFCLNVDLDLDLFSQICHGHPEGISHTHNSCLDLYRDYGHFFGSHLVLVFHGCFHVYWKSDRQGNPNVAFGLLEHLFEKYLRSP